MSATDVPDLARRSTSTPTASAYRAARDGAAPALAMAVGHRSGSGHGVDVRGVAAPGRAVERAFGENTQRTRRRGRRRKRRSPSGRRAARQRRRHGPSSGDGVSGNGAAGVRLGGEEWTGERPGRHNDQACPARTRSHAPGPSAGAIPYVAGKGDAGRDNLDHPLVNDSPGTLVFATQDVTAAGADAATTACRRRCLPARPQSLEPREPGRQHRHPSRRLASSVTCGAANEHTFVHTATAENIDTSWTVIDHPLANDNPDVLLLVTQTGRRQIRPIDIRFGVWYDEMGRWAIEQDRDANACNALQCRPIMAAGDSASVRRASAQEHERQSDRVPAPLINNAPGAHLFMATANFSPSSRGGTLNNHPTRRVVQRADRGAGAANVDQAASRTPPSIFIFSRARPASGSETEMGGQTGDDGGAQSEPNGYNVENQWGGDGAPGTQAGCGSSAVAPTTSSRSPHPPSTAAEPRRHHDLRRQGPIGFRAFQDRQNTYGGGEPMGRRRCPWNQAAPGCWAARDEQSVVDIAIASGTAAHAAGVMTPRRRGSPSASAPSWVMTPAAPASDEDRQQPPKRRQYPAISRHPAPLRTPASCCVSSTTAMPWASSTGSTSTISSRVRCPRPRRGGFPTRRPSKATRWEVDANPRKSTTHPPTC